jgi:hypothetical protein
MAVENWLQRSHDGDNLQHGKELLGTWKRGYQQHDLVVLHQPPADDEEFARTLKPGARAAYDWVAGCRRRVKVIASYQDLAAGHVDDPVYVDTDSKFRTASGGFGEACVTTIFSLFPALMILWLNNVANTQDRIYITIGTTAILGSLISFLTNGSMKEVLSITIA